MESNRHTQTIVRSVGITLNDWTACPRVERKQQTALSSDKRAICDENKSGSWMERWAECNCNLKQSLGSASLPPLSTGWAWPAPNCRHDQSFQPKLRLTKAELNGFLPTGFNLSFNSPASPSCSVEGLSFVHHGLNFNNLLTSSSSNKSALRTHADVSGYNSFKVMFECVTCVDELTGNGQERKLSLLLPVVLASCLLLWCLQGSWYQ